MRFLRVVILTAGLTALAACAPGITVTDPGSTRETPVKSTLSGIAYKTFGERINVLQRATVRALRRMSVAVLSERITDGGRTILAERTDRKITVELESLARNRTKMRVIVTNERIFFKDRKMGREIIERTIATLRGEPVGPTS